MKKEFVEFDANGMDDKKFICPTCGSTNFVCSKGITHFFMEGECKDCKKNFTFYFALKGVDEQTEDNLISEASRDVGEDWIIEERSDD